MVSVNNKVKASQYDIAVIGGGPAGMMAAIKAAEGAAKVVLLEKNKRLGWKLSLTGKGRCNITNSELDLKRFISNFGPSGKFLFSVLPQFGVAETIEFFNQQGLKTKVERGQRVFPASDQSIDVVKLLTSRLSQLGVEIRFNCSVTALVKGQQTIAGIKIKSGLIKAKQYIICTGGLSYPATGSTGDGFKWAKNLGHKVNPTRPALAPVITKEPWVKDLQGLSLKNVTISIYCQDKKQDQAFGEALFTHEGMSGPIILDLSQKIGQLFSLGPVQLKIDFKPALDYPTLDKRLQRDLTANSRKAFKNSLDQLLPQKLIPVIVKLSAINPEKKTSEVTKLERKKLLPLLKALTLTVTNLAGYEQAIVTHGGIVLSEIDPRTMRSRLIKNLFFAGEVIDLDGPTGGFNLQVCWSTGYVAGQSASGAL